MLFFFGLFCLFVVVFAQVVWWYSLSRINRDNRELAYNDANDRSTIATHQFWQRIHSIRRREWYNQERIILNFLRTTFQHVWRSCNEHILWTLKRHFSEIEIIVIASWGSKINRGEGTLLDTSNNYHFLGDITEYNGRNKVNSLYYKMPQPNCLYTTRYCCKYHFPDIFSSYIIFFL